MTLLGRERPELPAEVLFSDMEILALKDFAQDRRLRLPDTLGPTVVTLAMLGGQPEQRPAARPPENLGRVRAPGDHGPDLRKTHQAEPDQQSI